MQHRDDDSSSHVHDAHVHTASCSPHDHRDHAHHHESAAATAVSEEEISDEQAFILELVDAFQDEPANTLTRVQELLQYFPQWVDLCDADGRTALFFAVYARNLELVRVLLAAGASADASAQVSGESIMVLACMLGDVEIVHLLMQYGAAFNDVHMLVGNISPLYAACKCGHVEIVQLLVRNGAFLDDVDEDGATPFMVAAGNGHLRIVTFLADMGAGTERATPSGLSVAYYAAYSGNFRMLRFFIEERMALRDADGQLTNLLDGAVRGGQLVIATYLLETLNLEDEQIDQCLALAVRFEHVELVKLLLLHDADVDALDAENGKSALHVAAQVGDAEIAEVLITSGADLTRATTSTGYTPIHEMAKTGHRELLELVHKLRPETDFTVVSQFDALTPLHLAAGNGHTEAVRFLVSIVQERGDIDAPGPRGQTPLIVAAEYGFLGAVQVLVSVAGANIDARTDNGSTALIGAAYIGELDLVRYLCECGADVDLATTGNVTALHAAAQYGHVDVVEYLLEERRASADFSWTGASSLLAGPVMNGHLFVIFVLAAHGARLDYKGGQHLSPLHLAAQYKQPGVVRLLVLASGVDVNAVNEFEEDGVELRSTPLIVAAQRGYLDIVKCLCEHGADVELPKHDGMRALDVARAAARSDVVKYLVTERNAHLEGSLSSESVF